MLSYTPPPTSTHVTWQCVIDRFKLQSCRDTYIGNTLIRGISGGERKRTAVGVELIARPNILLLDEPTSGLDSHAAYSLAQRLTERARDEIDRVSATHREDDFIS